MLAPVQIMASLSSFKSSVFVVGQIEIIKIDKFKNCCSRRTLNNFNYIIILSVQ